MKKIVALVLSLVMVLGLATTAFAAASATYTGLYVVSTDSTTPADDAVLTTLEFFKEVAPKYNKTTGARTDLGAVAYFTDGMNNYVQVATLAEADVVAFADEACKKVKFYLADAVDTVYADATVFTNVGDACGEYDLETVLGDDYDDDMVFYAVKGVTAPGSELIMFADKAGTNVLKVNGKFVTATMVGVETPVEHVAVVEYDKDMNVEKIYCSACDCVAAKAANVMSMPTGAVAVDGFSPWYWTTATAAVEGETVESAKTFDAGIAMYVGMSVMAAAGSAVVLKKKD